LTIDTFYLEEQQKKIEEKFTEAIEIARSSGIDSIIRDDILDILIALVALGVLIYFQSAGAMYVAFFLPLLLVGIPKTIIASKYLFFMLIAVVMSIISFVLCVVAGLFFKELTLALCVKCNSGLIRTLKIVILFPQLFPKNNYLLWNTPLFHYNFYIYS